MKTRRRLRTDYLRSVVFGVEDGLVSTTGAVVGIGIGAENARLVVLAGLVIIAVEAISMAAGEFVTEETVNAVEKRSRRGAFKGALIMFCSYFAAGLIPVLPFMIFPLNPAMISSVVLALISLFGLGYLRGKKITHSHPLRSGFEILLIGGIAAIIGVVVGSLLKV